MEGNEKARFTIAACVFTLALCPAGIARTIYVANDAPADFTTIQAAIDDANDGDTVIIQPGTYTGPGNRDISIKNKVITVQSVDPNDPNVVAATVIDCEGTQSAPHRGFYFSNARNAPSPTLAGLTIIHGYEINGGGIYCIEDASPMIRNCRLIGNHAWRGGGLYIGYGTPTVRNCAFLNNSASHTKYRGEGGGIFCASSWTPITISGCIIAGNSASGVGTDPGAGGGMYLNIYSGSVRHCTIIGNSADTGGGIYCDAYGGMAVADCIVRSNRASQGPQISGSTLVCYSNVEGGWSGLENIDADPLFVDPASGDRHLSTGSPCIDAGDPQYVPYAGQTDCDNQPRVMGLRADMGADEFTSTPTGILDVYPKQLVFHADVNGPAPERQVLHVQDAGFAPLTWVVAEDSPWLVVTEPADGIGGVSLGIGPMGLSPGQYDCQVTVTADHVPNSPQVVAVRLYVRAGRYLHVPSPYRTIQSAVESAQNGDTVIIAEGTYTGLGNRDIDLRGKAVTVRSTDPNNPAIVGATVIHCGGTKTEPHRGFIFQSGEDANSVLAGLTITGGSGTGAGIYVDGSSPTILYCNITGNGGTSFSGGGIYVRLGSPYIGQCLIADNQCGDDAGRGGGIYSSGDPIIVDCIIRSNGRAKDGGGIFFNGGSPVVSGCVIVDNDATFSGGAIYSLYTAGALDHCLIADNRAGGTGGGTCFRNSELTVRNCTIAGNTANNSAGGLYFSLGKLSLVNTILWANVAKSGREMEIYTWSGAVDARGGFYKLSGIVDILTCDIEGGRSKVYVHSDTRCLQLNWGTNNIDADPLFADPANSDYHLKSQVGRWESGSGSWVIDEVTSPCIDAGDPNSPVGDEPEPNGGRINMGAYGGTAEASKSYPGK